MLRRRIIKKEMLISIEPKEKRIAVIDEGRLEEFHVERASSKRIVGNIYKGKVSAIVPGIGAAFVDIGTSKNGFLYLDEKEGVEDIFTPQDADSAEPATDDTGSNFSYRREIVAPLAKGQEVLVQVGREEIGTKGPRLTRRISIPGRYLVLVPSGRSIGVSKRIENPAERARIRKILSSFRLPGDMGFIVRTEAEGMSRRDFARELRYLINAWKNIVARAKTGSTPSLIYEEYDLVLRAARDLVTRGIERVLIDSKEEFRRIYGFIRTFLPNLRRRVRLYKGRVPIFESFGIQKQIDAVFDRRVQLKSGGYLIIEPTEALVAIDVNTGQFIGKADSKKDPEETAFITNREAAREISRQLRLKDLGGLIVMDFIDMKTNEHRKIVLNELKEGVVKDKAKIKILNFSEFGLVEMTRQRVRRGLESSLYQSCPRCKGRGLIKDET